MAPILEALARNMLSRGWEMNCMKFERLNGFSEIYRSPVVSSASKSPTK